MKKNKFDSVILGCGVSGLATACVLAKQGLQVAMVEKQENLGGKTTNAFVGTLCGLFFRTQKPQFDYCSDGFMKEFAIKLQNKSKMEPVFQKDGLQFLPYHKEALSEVFHDYLNTNKIHVFYNSRVSEARTNEGQVREVLISEGSSQFWLEAKTFVDASGTAELANLLGIPCLNDSHYQQAHLTVSFSYDSKESDPKLEFMFALTKAKQQGKIAPALALATVLPGHVHPNMLFVKVPILTPITTEKMDLFKLREEGINHARSIQKVLTELGPSFKNTELIEVAKEAGVRTQARHWGKSVLSYSDIMNTKKEAKAFTKGTWPIEIWRIGKPVEIEYLPFGDYYSIPDTSLRSASIANLFFAGRNISADEKAIASARVTGTCLQMGEQVAQLILKGN